MIERTPLSGEPVLLAPHRDERPNVYDGAPCPFCPGAEHETPPEIARDGDPWRIRVFPNRYPPTEYAEVIVETAKHEQAFDELAPDHAERAAAIWFERYAAMRRSCVYVAVFKNDGRLAGASIPHIHSQVVGTPFVPPRAAAEASAFGDRCGVCCVEHALIRETENYRWIAPRGARFAYQQWIVPKTHAPEMSEPRELSSLVQQSARAMRRIAGAYNWAFVNFPNEPRGHWYLELFPRTAMVAGFELGTGTFVNSLGADEAAAHLRQ